MLHLIVLLGIPEELLDRLAELLAELLKKPVLDLKRGACTRLGGCSQLVEPAEKIAEVVPQSAVIVLFHLGSCKGHRAYDAIEWYFPEHGQHYRPNSYIAPCTGQYHE